MPGGVYAIYDDGRPLWKQRMTAGRSWEWTCTGGGNFNNFLLLVLYLFVPWTAVNLVDYYIVRRGHYAIAEIFDPPRHVRALGVARHPRLSHRLCRHDTVLQRWHPSMKAPQPRHLTEPTSRSSSGCR